MNISSTSNDDNNPFDIAENKDYFKSQDVEIKQLIINVIWTPFVTVFTIL